MFIFAKHIHKIALAALLAGIHLNASAQVINFDSGLTSGALIPNGFAGLNWDNFYALDTSTIQPSGYFNGTVSPNFVAYNGFGTPATFSSASPFTFNSAYLTSAWNDGLNVVVDAYSGSTLVHSASFTLNTTAPVLQTFNWANVSSVIFTTSGGVQNPAFSSTGTQLAVDDLNVTPAVPEAGSNAMLMIGLGIMGLMAVRKNRSWARLTGLACSQRLSQYQ